MIGEILGIELHYVGVDSPEIAKQRIAERVKMGGHGIPDKDVEKRFGESLRNLHEIIDLCDLAALYDNTNEFRRFAIYKSRLRVKRYGEYFSHTFIFFTYMTNVVA